MSFHKSSAKYEITEKGKRLLDWAKSHPDTCLFVSKAVETTVDDMLEQMPFPDDMKYELKSKSAFTLGLQIQCYLAEGGSEKYIVSRIASNVKKVMQKVLLEMLTETFEEAQTNQSVDEMD